MKNKPTDTATMFRVEVEAKRIAAIFQVLAEMKTRREWTPENFVACAIDNQIEMLRLCGQLEHVDGNLRPQIPVSFSCSDGGAYQSRETKPLARVLRLVPPSKSENPEP